MYKSVNTRILLFYTATFLYFLFVYSNLLELQLGTGSFTADYSTVATNLLYVQICEQLLKSAAGAVGIAIVVLDKPVEATSARLMQLEYFHRAE